MSADADFDATFAALKSILVKYAPKLTVVTDKPGDYYLDGRYSEQHKKPIFFGAVRTGKNYVSFHLMPIYGCPQLVEGLSDELKKRMQGKSCFNFKTITPGQVKELKALTKRGFEVFKKLGWV
jgi:hypothetical protein